MRQFLKLPVFNINICLPYTLTLHTSHWKTFCDVPVPKTTDMWHWHSAWDAASMVHSVLIFIVQFSGYKLQNPNLMLLSLCTYDIESGLKWPLKGWGLLFKTVHVNMICMQICLQVLREVCVWWVAVSIKWPLPVDTVLGWIHWQKVPDSPAKAKSLACESVKSLGLFHHKTFEA